VGVSPLLIENGKGSLHRCREPFLLWGFRLRPPATETSHVAGLCLGLPDALHVGQVDHRFRERVSVTQDPLSFYSTC
jgi:hypothetical protein